MPGFFLFMFVTVVMDRYSQLLRSCPALIGKVLLLTTKNSVGMRPFLCLKEGMVVDLSTATAYSSLLSWLDALDREGVDTVTCRTSPLAAVRLSASSDATLETLEKAVDHAGIENSGNVIADVLHAPNGKQHESKTDTSSGTNDNPVNPLGEHNLETSQTAILSLPN